MSQRVTQRYNIFFIILKNGIKLFYNSVTLSNPFPYVGGFIKKRSLKTYIVYKSDLSWQKLGSSRKAWFKITTLVMLKNEGIRKGEWIAKTVSLSHVFLLDQNLE